MLWDCNPSASNPVAASNSASHENNAIDVGDLLCECTSSPFRNLIPADVDFRLLFDVAQSLSENSSKLYFDLFCGFPSCCPRLSNTD